jgi:hypothetical protein
MQAKNDLIDLLSDGGISGQFPFPSVYTPARLSRNLLWPDGMRWEVLNWNASAIDFYRSLGAKIQDRWLPVLFMGREFDEFASQQSRDGQ